MAIAWCVGIAQVQTYLVVQFCCWSEHVYVSVFGVVYCAEVSKENRVFLERHVSHFHVTHKP